MEYNRVQNSEESQIIIEKLEREKEMLKYLLKV